LEQEAKERVGFGKKQKENFNYLAGDRCAIGD
jgi:hypothetical protein